MDSGLIGKIDKAKRYAEERDRIVFTNFQATLKGDNNDHTVSYEQGKWDCTCSYFKGHNLCGHTMAMEIILDDMVQKAEHPEISL